MLGIRSKKIKYEKVATPNDPLKLDCGEELDYVEIAYEIFGRLNEKRTNAILICHAFSGDSHVGAYDDEPELRGWWDKYVGPGKVFDTEKYVIICSNVLGGCMGSTGPSSINPKTGKPYNLTFPVITIRDMVNAQARLIKKLGIERLLAVVGGSMGGMQVMEWAINYPDMIIGAIAIATTSRLSAQGIAFNEVGRRAIMMDPNWNNGNYPAETIPARGLALARMIAHITYLSDESMRQKFGRELRNFAEYQFDFIKEFQVESYLHYQGQKFTQRFDANTYLYLSKAIDYFDLEYEYGSLDKAFSNVKCPFLVLSFSSDWLYPTYQAREIVFALQRQDKDVSFIEIQSNYGHDAFLLEYDKMAPVMINFFKKIENSP